MKDPQNRVEALACRAESLGQFARGYFAYLAEVLGRVDSESLDRVVESLLAARESGGTIYTLGNGGSAATASHATGSPSRAPPSMPPGEAACRP